MKTFEIVIKERDAEPYDQRSRDIWLAWQDARFQDIKEDERFIGGQLDAIHYAEFSYWIQNLEAMVWGRNYEGYRRMQAMFLEWCESMNINWVPF